MKNKQTVTITIDTEVYLKIRLMDKINLSGVINEYLKETFMREELNKEQLSQELEEIKKREHILAYEIERIKAKEAKQRQLKLTEEEQRRKELRNSIPKGNDFYSKLRREAFYREHPEMKEEGGGGS